MLFFCEKNQENTLAARPLSPLLSVSSRLFHPVADATSTTEEGVYILDRAKLFSMESLKLDMESIHVESGYIGAIKVELVASKIILTGSVDKPTFIYGVEGIKFSSESVSLKNVFITMVSGSELVLEPKTVKLVENVNITWVKVTGQMFSVEKQVELNSVEELTKCFKLTKV